VYGASAHLPVELLRTYADLHGLDCPEPALTDRIPRL
jgi:hypothetical protein